MPDEQYTKAPNQPDHTESVGKGQWQPKNELSRTSALKSLALTCYLDELLWSHGEVSGVLTKDR